MHAPVARIYREHRLFSFLPFRRREYLRLIYGLRYTPPARVWGNRSAATMLTADRAHSLVRDDEGEHVELDHDLGVIAYLRALFAVRCYTPEFA